MIRFRNSERPHFSREEHDKIGLALRETHATLTSLVCRLDNARARCACKTINWLGHLRSEMENLLFEDFPDEAEGSTYYGLGAESAIDSNPSPLQVRRKLESAARLRRIEEAKTRRFQRSVFGLLQRTPLEEWTCLGLIGRGYPNSLYKLCLRHGRRWWIVENDPLYLKHYQLPECVRDRKEGRLMHVEFVEGPLSVLKGLTCMPSSEALVQALGIIQQRL